MPKCHQCSGDLDDGQRNGDCKVCYSKGVDLCQRCAMWELGPRDADPKLKDALRKVKESAQVQRQDSEKPVLALAKIGDEPLACDVFLPTMGDACDFFKDQLTNVKATLYGKAFDTYVCDVLDKFRDLYKTCKFDRLAIQVLLAMHLSAQERVQCRTTQDTDGESVSDAAKMVKRWQTREIAVQHLKAHLQDIEDAFGKTIRDIVEQPAWIRALGMDDIEFFLKGFKHPTLMAIDLLKASGSSAAQGRETLEVAIILYHSLTATRTRTAVKGHWSSKRPNFSPKEALGFLSGEHFERLYGDVEVAKDFAKPTQDALDRLWNVLGDGDEKNKLPAHPRYPDLAVSGAGLLDATEKSYLQYLPAFDHPESAKDDRTACETAVRTRVVATLKKYLAHYGPVAWYRVPDFELSWKEKAAEKGTTKTLTVREAQRGDSLVLTFKRDVINATKELIATEKDKIQPFIKGLLDADDLRANHCRLEIEIEGEAGNDRRKARRKAVEDAVKEAFEAEKEAFSWRPTFVDDGGALKGDAPVEALVDAICAKMRADFCVDQAFDVGVSRMIVTAAMSDRTFAPKAWFPLKTKDVDYTAILPDCFAGGVTLPTIEDHYEDTGGSSPRPAHYMDWRNHKDHWLYDCFPIERRRRPLFGSLSVQPFLPGPNPNYGGHILYYKRPPLAGRTVFTFGDKQQPRRSMLLLLDTIMHGRKKKDGAAAQSAASRQAVLFELLRRADMVEFWAGKTDEALWKRTMGGELVRYPDGDLLIECQIFGGIDLTVDGRGFVAAHEAGDGDFYVKSLHLATAELTGAAGKLASVYPGMIVHSYEPHADRKDRPKSSTGDAAWASDLSEIAE